MQHSISFKQFLHATGAGFVTALAPVADSVVVADRVTRLARGEWVEAGGRGMLNRRVVLQRRRGGTDWRYHATKGWRSRRVAA